VLGGGGTGAGGGAAAALPGGGASAGLDTLQSLEHALGEAANFDDSD
jgi:hypothetical protein